MGSPIAILNIGPTRADDLARLKIDARSGEVCVEPCDIRTCLKTVAFEFESK